MIKNILVSTNTSVSSFIFRIVSNCVITLYTGVLHCHRIPTKFSGSGPPNFDAQCSKKKNLLTAFIEL